MSSTIKMEIISNDDGSLSLKIDASNEKAIITIDRNYKIDFKRTKTIFESRKKP